MESSISSPAWTISCSPLLLVSRFLNVLLGTFLRVLFLDLGILSLCDLDFLECLRTLREFDVVGPLLRFVHNSSILENSIVHLIRADPSIAFLLRH